MLTNRDEERLGKFVDLEDSFLWDWLFGWRRGQRREGWCVVGRLDRDTARYTKIGLCITKGRSFRKVEVFKNNLLSKAD